MGDFGLFLSVISQGHVATRIVFFSGFSGVFDVATKVAQQFPCKHEIPLKKTCIFVY